MGEGLVRYLTPTNSFLLFVFLRLCEFWRKSIKKCERESERRRTEANWFYNLSHAICYSCGTDDKLYQHRSYSKVTQRTAQQ